MSSTSTMVWVAPRTHVEKFCQEATRNGYWPICTHGNASLVDEEPKVRARSTYLLRTHLQQIMERERLQEGTRAARTIYIAETLDQVPTTGTMCLMPVNRAFQAAETQEDEMYLLAYWIRLATDWVVDTQHHKCCYPGPRNHLRSLPLGGRTSGLLELAPAIARVRMYVDKVQSHGLKHHVHGRETSAVVRNAVFVAAECYQALERASLAPNLRGFDANAVQQIELLKNAVSVLFRKTYES